MKNALVALVATLSVLAGASAFARDGGGDGGDRTQALSMAHRDTAVAAYAAAHSTQSVDTVAQK